MIVRCGRCGDELKIAGPGEFACPSCGTRNVARGQQEPPAADPFGVPDLSPAAPQEPPPGVTWVRCPACSYRFAVGEMEEVSCPSCATTVHLEKQETGTEPS